MTDHEPNTPETREQAPESGPRIYVTSLSDYNNGRLHGAWIDAAQEPEQLHAAISKMLADSPEPGAEEYAIHEFDGFGAQAIGEYEPIESVSLLARGIQQHGEAFAAWWSTTEPGSELQDLQELSERFEERYQGEWDSLTDYAQHLLDDLGDTEALEAMPDWLQPYISLDIEGFARDLELSGDVNTSPAQSGGVFVFDREWS